MNTLAHFLLGADSYNIRQHNGRIVGATRLSDGVHVEPAEIERLARHTGRTLSLGAAVIADVRQLATTMRCGDDRRGGAE